MPTPARVSTVVSLAGALFLGAWTAIGTAQIGQLTPIREAGQTVTPAFEGWYKNADGTFSLSFGYLNRNSKEVIEVPIGPNNFVSPGAQNQGQPTSFAPRRHWGVFTVTVPADFGDKRIVWTLTFRGQTYAIPGSLKRGWEIDALEGEVGSGNTPPRVKFAASGPEGRGPGGITSGLLTATVGQPLAITAWVTDDSRAGLAAARGGRGGVTVTPAWFKHQGPGAVTFDDSTPAVNPADGRTTVQATFNEPGSYVLRLRVNDSSGVVGAGHAQCCWTNGFVKVTVK
jgi:hypothetical protein